MKSSKCFLVISLFTLFISCKQADAVPYYGIDFLFKAPQPIDDREVNHLPNRFIGNYTNQDSTNLIIENKTVYYKWKTKNNISFSEFDSIKDSLRILENRIYFDDKFVEFRKLKDSVEITDVNYDTIFSISDFQKVKRIKNSIVFSTKDSIYWKMKILTLDNNRLTIKTLVSDEDLKRMDSLSKIKAQKLDSTKIIVQLSKKEFKKMLTLKRFGYDQNFKKTD
ncbi:hypothetical protein [Flavobacterium sangjuense]|uniref:Outer membrane lipoprotein carrier protein LolA n=1 Tax=Flavobacterium sangjuense TaxID=2518177 RepID=A0A4P7PVB8_9FLAO|nr:hypothetical protein [Flavobacterium sangjuense]QBZ98716.1 hypothetical protein GS03_02226 [Flavobacterium sangjuense]